MAKISDVARRAGVSTATVSRALNGKPSVDPELVDRVRAVARELGYRPNALARGLRRQETSVLALIISDVENPFFTSVARGVEDVARVAGYSVVLCNSDEDVTRERRYVEVALQEQVAGLLLSPTSAASDLSALVDQRVPLVAVDRPLADGGADTVLVDSRLAARTATQHLVEAGYSRIACVTGPNGSWTAEARVAGYREALDAAGRPFRPELVHWSDFRVAGGRRAVAGLLATADRPDALLVANNLMAVGALQALGEAGLRTGVDVGLVAFDDAPWTTLVAPALTVVAQPAYEVGAAAARLLLGRIGGQAGEPVTVELAASLLVRGSSVR